MSLAKEGWVLKKEVSMGHNDLLDVDLATIGDRIIPKDITNCKEFPSPKILQIKKVKDVGHSKIDSNKGNGKSIFKVTLTDGLSTINAINLVPLAGLNGKVLPGVKVKLRRNVPLVGGFLLLSSENTLILGGRVDKLIDNIEKNQNINKKVLGTDGDGPPQFRPFRAGSQPQPRPTQEIVRDINNRDVNERMKDLDLGSPSARNNADQQRKKSSKQNNPQKNPQPKKNHFKNSRPSSSQPREKRHSASRSDDRGGDRTSHSSTLNDFLPEQQQQQQQRETTSYRRDQANHSRGKPDKSYRRVDDYDGGNHYRGSHDDNYSHSKNNDISYRGNQDNSYRKNRGNRDNSYRGNRDNSYRGNQHNSHRGNQHNSHRGNQHNSYRENSDFSYPENKGNSYRGNRGNKQRSNPHYQGSNYHDNSAPYFQDTGSHDYHRQGPPYHHPDDAEPSYQFDYQQAYYQGYVRSTTPEGHGYSHSGGFNNDSYSNRPVRQDNYSYYRQDRRGNNQYRN